jgi:vitamin K-dependent gamma-carboxylase
MQLFSGQNRNYSRLFQKLIEPADNSTLIIFRVWFGFLLFYHCLAFAGSGELHKNFIAPPFTFTYIGFEFLQPLPGMGMYVYFGIMALLALLIMAGAFYRFAITGFTVLWALVYLMQKSNYNNHYYLMLLLCLLMCFMPAAGFFSVDSKRNPALKKNTCARWVYFLFMAQTAVIYLYAAVSKLNADWLSGRFIALQFAPLTTHRFTGPVYGNPYFQLLVVYGGFLFDLLIVPLLFWKKTRYYAFALFVGFHLFNSYSFRIGIFPYLSIGMGLFFLSPEKIRQLFFKNKASVMQQAAGPVFVPALQKFFLAAMFIYLFIQLLLPLRPALFPGPVFWTEEGYRMSWKMMLRTKTGRIHFKVVDPVSGKTWQHDPASKFAASHVTWLAICPDIAWQYAQRLKKNYKNMGYPAVAVYAIDSVSLNKNPPQLLIDTTVNLAAVTWHPFRHSWWILPYTKQP